MVHLAKIMQSPRWFCMQAWRTNSCRHMPCNFRCPVLLASHSSQGQTADRVLIHADTELGAKDLLNNRMAYVAVSRGAYDAQIFTNDREKLGAALGHDVSHSSAHAPEIELVAENRTLG